MSRKKKKNKQAKEIVRKPALESGKADERKIPWVIVTGVVLLAAFGFYWFGIRSTEVVEEKADSVARLSFPEIPANPIEHISFEDFVGPEACASCHTENYNKWKNSTHGQAGGSPDEVKIIGAFDGKPRKFKDATLTPYRAENGDYMFNLKTTDLPEKTFKVDAVVGGGHMIAGGTQTYFSKFPDGTLRMLPFDFIRDEQVWFGETSKGQGWVPITPDRIIDKESEWEPTRILGTHLDRQNCQECHGSQIELEYALDEKKYSTRYNTLAINCESCHGPGKEHIRIVSEPNWRDMKNIGLQPLATVTKDESLDICFRCHSLKNVLQVGFLPGMDLEEYYSVKFPIMGFRGENPYNPDGRIKEFAYQLNHENSDCYINGSMTCVDCHDPHDQSYRDIDWKELADPFDDGQCTSCHVSKAINPTAHSFHKEGSEGNKCVSCHMPYLQHQAIGSHLRFARSDHTIPIPRPAFDESIGIESACLQCHKDKSVDWLEDKVAEWYGEIKPHNPMVQRLVYFDPNMDITVGSKFLLPDSTDHFIGQMAGLSEFAFTFLKPNMNNLGEETVSKLKTYIQSMDVDVQSLAMASLHLTQDNNDQIHNMLVEKLGELNEANRRKVMKRWANSLPLIGKKYEEAGNYNDAIEAYRKSLEISPENTMVLINMAMAYSSADQNLMAVKVLEQAIKSDPNNYDAWINKGNILFQLGRNPDALSAYKSANRINPWNSSSYFNIGNYYYSTNNISEAISWYKKAVEIEPQMALGYFFLARSYIKTQNFREAYVETKAGLRLDPKDQAGQQMKADLEKYYSQ